MFQSLSRQKWTKIVLLVTEVNDLSSVSVKYFSWLIVLLGPKMLSNFFLAWLCCLEQMLIINVFFFLCVSWFGNKYGSNKMENYPNGFQGLKEMSNFMCKCFLSEPKSLVLVFFWMEKKLHFFHNICKNVDQEAEKRLQSCMYHAKHSKFHRTYSVLCLGCHHQECKLVSGKSKTEANLIAQKVETKRTKKTIWNRQTRFLFKQQKKTEN